MALRRSARLSALPTSNAALLQPPTTAQARKNSSNSSSSSKAPQPNKITKARKSAAKGKTTPTATTLEQSAPLTTIPVKTTTLLTTTIPSPEISSTPANIWDSVPTNDYGVSRPRHTTPPPLDRPVEPHRTNATLLTPHGSSLVAYPPGTENESPTKTGRPRPTATTGTLLENAIAHLIATDPRLGPIIKAHPCPLFTPEGLAEAIDPFRSLVQSIIGQQVSGAAAKSIRDRFVALFSTGKSDEEVPDGFPTPHDIIKKDIETLRTAGLSQRKAEYILGLSQKFADGELSAKMLLNATDEELVEKLTAVRGLGLWSVEMFACFALKRIDVFSTGDLGVQRGCAVFTGKDVNKLKGKGGGKFKYMAEKDMLELAAKFAPYRSLFMWYMWRVTDVNISAMNS
ncbi:DNA-3-methyladenine glycosylase II [Aspergillus saccharolyticus JOP 1030-1]|uniref:3-methyladenine DNA glycosidase n=1 Tax=Aspergillus saccharolyticus JOP 1030-1 TaxID=1450539 RepID=A0A318ZCK4_9EURO|nr:3-methyladenine DNA glycosidase [Aspergillus saccharolyticus JOP 1030-1]PYH45186.1 3-methyladenine DNA glycosidase [Aspergillus saccharolyticus JOP 1030-1]